MDERMQEVLMKNMADNLPTLRKKLDVNQDELAAMVGVSRSTIAFIENKKRPMTWNMFLSLILIFTKNKETDILLTPLEIYTDELNNFIKQKDNRSEVKLIEHSSQGEKSSEDN